MSPARSWPSTGAWRCEASKGDSVPLGRSAGMPPAPLNPHHQSAPQGHFRTHSVGLGAPPLPTVRGAAGPLIGLAKRETGRARSKEKGAWMRSGAVALRAEGGRRIGACSDLALPSGTLGPSAIPPTAVPRRMVRKLPGCKDAFELLRFSCLALRRSGDFRHQCSTGSSFRAFGFATHCPGGHRSCSLALC